MAIHTGHVSPQSIATEAIITYIFISQSQNGDDSQLEAMSPTLPQSLSNDIWCAFNFLPIRRKDQKYPGLDLLKNVKGSGVRKLAINSNNVWSAEKRPERLCQRLGRLHAGWQDAISVCSVNISKML